MKNIKLGLSSKTANEVVDAYFEDNEYQTLIDYYHEIEKIKRNSSFFNDFHVSLKIKSEIGIQPKYDIKFPDEEKILLSLHLMRPFLLNDEELYFYKIVKLLNRRIENEKARKIIEYNKDLFSGKDSQKQIIVHVDDLIVNSEEFLMKYLNAFEYHRDKEKKTFFSGLFMRFPEEFARFFVVSLIIDKMKAVINIGNLIGLMLGQIKKFIVE